MVGFIACSACRRFADTPWVHKAHMQAYLVANWTDADNSAGGVL
jgi:hypothetical protein